MIVMTLTRFFKAGAAIAEIMLTDNIGFFQQTHGAIHRGDANMRINHHRALEYFFYVRMVARLR
jgi:hypothetical protein